jgi:transposase
VRAAWHAAAQALDPAALVFVDESGTHLALTPVYARAPRGERAHGVVPADRGTNVTLLAALSLRGAGAAMTVTGAADALVFEAYVRDVLAPTLRPGQIVVLDNVRSHKGDTVRALIEARGCRLLFLPAYSPDYSPIEHAFSKVKALLRRAAARTRDTLDAAIGEALAAISGQDARGWFTACGYHVEAQSL